jgi:NAD(P)-dependent dehydrogenase (short-subunit alcohol dehydrogenase family)
VKADGSTPNATEVTVATSSSPDSSPNTLRALRLALAACVTAPRASVMNALPAAVSRTPLGRAAVPAMLDSGGGSLVHVGSDSGRLPEVGNQDYAAAKLALLALSKSLATEFSPRGIRSNVVVPGPTRTPLYDRPGGFGDQAAELWGIDKESAITRMVTEIRPLLTHKMGQPDDVAQVIAYLVSPLSRQVTAAEWTVDGGALRQV